jgi:hypothetical protein
MKDEYISIGLQTIDDVIEITDFMLKIMQAHIHPDKLRQYEYEDKLETSINRLLWLKRRLSEEKA